MNANEELIRRFYTAFQRLDYKTMQDCYSEDPIFNDPAFGILEGDEVRAMWEMLCKGARDFSLEFSNIQLLDEEYATCNWRARYTFSKSGRKVVNNIKAHMRIQDGKITEHSDQFDIWKWSRQALGLSGMLLGWSGYLKSKIRRSARSNLARFMEGKSLGH
ncbi:MAG TPA: nuclear transport factor 2 family protein [Chitinophagaceae bacterium]|nr:nuclear transport factor 2 family protein [Chitinophagaceae bacterium]